MKKTPFRWQRSRRERGSAIVETLICVMLLLLILFGLLQVFQFSIAQMVTDYSAFRAARSSTVGFNDSVVMREGKLKAIPASGKMVFPVDLRASDNLSDWTEREFSDSIGQFYYERFAIMDYMRHRRLVDYEYWDSENKSFTGAATTYSVNETNSGNRMTVRTKFTDYPWTMMMRTAFLGAKDKVDIEAETTFARHSNVFLE